MCKIIGFMYMFAKGSPLSAPYGNKIPKLIKHPLYGAGIHMYIYMHIYTYIYNVSVSASVSVSILCLI